MVKNKIATRCMPIASCSDCRDCRQVMVYTGNPDDDVRKTIEPHMCCIHSGENWALVDEYQYGEGTPDWCPLPKFDAVLDFGESPMRWVRTGSRGVTER